MRNEYLAGEYAAERYRDFVREAEHDFLVQQDSRHSSPIAGRGGTGSSGQAGYHASYRTSGQSTGC